MSDDTANRRQRIIDCDTHFWQPIEMWEGLIEAEQRQAVKDAWDASGIGAQAAAPEVRKRVADAMEIRGADHVKERIEWMDEEGIDACVIYPSGTGLLCYLEDTAVAAAACRAVNRWSAEFAAQEPDRLYPCMLLPWYDPVRALAEFEAARELGLRLAFSAPTPSPTRRWSDPAYDPIWARMEEAGVIMTFHEFTRIPSGGESNLVARPAYKDSYPMMYMCGHTVEAQLALMDVVLGGVCHRFPRLAIGFVECHAAWVQGWLAMLDSTWQRPITSQKRMEEGLLDDTLPSEIFKRQGFVVAFPDDIGLDLLVEKLGPECLLLSTDYPHPQTTYGLVERFDRAYPEFDAKARSSVLGGNMAQLLEGRRSG